MKVLLVDDHPIFRRGVREILQERPEIASVAEAEDGAAALHQLRVAEPDLALFDIALPGHDGLELVTWCRDHAPGIECILLTMYDEPEYLERALELGVRGYLLKDDAASELGRCLDTVLEGDIYVSPRFGRARGALRPPPDARAERLLAALSPAQRAVLARVARFMTNREIAAELGLSHRTVENHRAHIATRLGLDGANALLRFAVQHAAWLEE
jgi:DNA-binding NarL/FixJ family response regulator